MTEPVRRPIIGLTTYRQTTSWGAWHREAALIPATYLDVLVRAGAQPVLLPPIHDTVDVPSVGTDVAPKVPEPSGLDAVCDGLDGLVLAGGGDVGPSRYDQTPDSRTAGTSEDRDRLEFDVLRLALERDMPVLAVCRGLQVLNVALGGDLVQHLPDRIGSDAHHPGPGAFASVMVTTEHDSHVGRLCGARVEVLCSHHQALDHLGRGLRITASSDDGVVEAAELEARTFVVGVQWHPEETGDTRLFEGLVAASYEWRSHRGRESTEERAS
jgi:anthranilate synthase component 2/putative glutamine amidotransferase